MNELMDALDKDLEKLIEDADKRSFGGRLERLRFLNLHEDQDPAPFDALALAYYQEARLCWVVGAFVATIVMCQLTLEEVLRSHYRSSKGVGGDLNKNKKVDRAGFADLIQQAKVDRWITKEEAALLHKLRKEYRNPFVHPADISIVSNSTKTDFFRQRSKMMFSELVEESAEEEARECMIIITSLLPKISRRLFGLA